MAHSLRDIDNSWNYEVSGAFDSYNKGKTNADNGNIILHLSKSSSASGFDSLESLGDTSVELTEEELEEEFTVCCDRCGAYIGYDKWHPMVANGSGTEFRDPGLCENCSYFLKKEYEDKYNG